MEQCASFGIEVARLANTPAFGTAKVEFRNRKIARRVLVADDNQDAANSLGLLLELYGHEVFTAYTGTQALEVAEKERPDLIFLDIGMPDMNGYEVARCIRDTEWGHGVTLVAATGYGTANDVSMAEGAGFNHHFLKPLEMKLLDEVLTSPQA